MAGKSFCRNFTFFKRNEMYDYIVVGLGLAGWNLVRVLQANRKNFVVFEPGGANSSTASAGVYNPVILKRFTPAWKAAEWLPYALLQYRQYEMEKGKKFVYPMPIYRKLTSEAEQNDWYAAAGRPVFENYMNGIRREALPGIEAPYGFGVMKNTGLVDVKGLLDTLAEDLTARRLLIRERFVHEKLKTKENYVEYEGIRARRIVFAEGYGLKHNPFFGHLPLMGTKGEALTVEPAEKPGGIVKSNVFMAPVPGSRAYLVGSTYNWTDKSLTPTREAREHLLEKFRGLYQGDFEVTGQRAGIRPTVKDRRPLLGRHPRHANLFVLNGMGTRGVILAPRSAKILFDYMEFGMDLPAEMDIRRFSDG